MASNETAVFGGGCFWCTEAIFSRVRGVRSVVSGYAGGTMKNPAYEDVSSGQTAHAEVVKLQFDPKVISYEELLDIFWHVHDPTTINQQGADVGSQYRSLILTTTPKQQKEAETFKQAIEASQIYDKKIVTEILPLDNFYTAEEYHQRYFEKNPQASYCQLVIAPKLKKFLEKYADKVKA